MDNLSRDLINRNLDEFKIHLETMGMAETTITERMKGAREFAKFLVNDPLVFNERTKGTI
ncbi:MAG: hypothetical protein V3T42_11980 [Nitrospirales bacterium]